MKYVFKYDFFSYVALVCSVLLLIAIFLLPSEFYKYLRIFIFLGAIIIGIKSFKIPFILFSFILISYLFNPIIPIFLFKKSSWIPVDLICAILFLLTTFNLKKAKPFIPYSKKNTPKSYGRDRKF